MKIQPNVRDKLHDIDHLLDDNYETIRLKFKENIFEDPEVDLKTGKKKKSRVKKEIDVERDLTILKDPKVFIDNLIKVRNLWEPDVLTRVSMNGDVSLKIIAYIFSCHQDPQVIFKYQGGKGESLSGVNKAIILAYCEDLQESHYNIRMIIELLQIHELHEVIA